MRLFSLVSLLVVMAVIALSVGVALSQQVNPARAVPDTVGTIEPYNVTPTRFLPETVEREGTFDVIVNFTSNAPGFRAISLTDLAPAGWNVHKAQCDPYAKATATGNKTQVLWQGGQSPWYPNNTDFTALYQVTVPPAASVGNYYSFDGFLMYYVSTCTTHYLEYITDGSEVRVIPPAICSNTSIDFYVPFGGTKNETLELWSSTPCMINWSLNLTDAADWLDAYPTSGNCTDEQHGFVEVSVNSSDMSIDDYSANITIEAPYPEANNSPREVPVTLHVTDSGILKGHVDFSRKESAGDPTWETPLVVRFFNATTHNETAWSPIINVITDAYGNFTIDDGIVPGTYDVGVKNWTSLSKMAYGQEFTVANITPIDFGAVIEADTDNDDQIRGADFNRVLVNFWDAPGDDGWNAMYDFDRSKRIDGADFNLVLTHYGEIGDIDSYLD